MNFWDSELNASSPLKTTVCVWEERIIPPDLKGSQLAATDSTMMIAQVIIAAQMFPL